MNWEILQKSNTHMRRSQICSLCLEEKYQVLKNNDTLKSRNELISKCRR